MEFMTGTQQKTLSAVDLKGGSFLNQTVCVHGAVHAIRAMGAIEFVTLRLRDGALQCVVDEAHEQLLEGVSQECAVAVTGTLRRRRAGPHGGGAPSGEAGSALQSEGARCSAHRRNTRCT